MSKQDAGKSPIQLLDPDFIFGIADVMAMGAAKYGVDDWKNNKGTDHIEDRCFGSIQRHLWDWKKGNTFDYESHLNALLHAATQIMMLYYYTGKHEKEEDNELRSEHTARNVSKAKRTKSFK